MKNKSSKLAAASKYGVAISSLFVANEIQADVETITWNGGEAEVILSIGQTGFSSQEMDLDQFPNGIYTIEFTATKYAFSSCVGSLSQACVTFSFESLRGLPHAIVGLDSFDSGERIQPGTVPSVSFPRKQFIGFVTTDGNQGWFRADITGSTTIYGSGQIATNGEDLIAGVFIGDDQCGAAVNLLDGVLTIDGTADDDVIEVFTLNGKVTARLNDCAEQFDGPVNEIVIDGQDGDDEISVTLNGDKTIFGQAGDDTITVNGPGAANIFGADGDDTIVGGSGPDIIEGGAGNDSLNGRGGADWLDGGAPVAGSPDMNTIDGGTGADMIFGGEDVDIIIAGDGPDTILTFGGDDLINGGLGNDEIIAGAGSDTIIGGPANDFISGGTGNDDISGGPGKDNIFGGAGEDEITGGSASDNIQGGSDNDTIEGNDGLDIIAGGPGDDTIFGGVGNDTISGGPGNDILCGQNQHDIINGEGGNDTLTGGIGFDELNGGGGTDTATDTGEAGESSIEN